MLLFRGRGAIASLIRWQSRGHYSHAALLMPDGRIVESWQGDGVRTKKLTDWDGVHRFEIPSMTEEQGRKALDFALSQVGRGYDYLGVLRFISRSSMLDDDRWFCSELVMESLRRADVRLFERVHSWEVSPGMLAASPLLRPVPLP